MALHARELARRNGDRIETRLEPLRLRIRIEDLPCADSHLLRLTFAASVRALPEAIEQRALAETFLTTSDSVTEEQLAAHFLPSIKSAAARACSNRPAAECVEQSGSCKPLIDALLAAANPIAFASGLEILPPFEVSIESETLVRQRREAAQRQLAEQRAAGQLQHLQRAGELLRQFQAIRGSTPGLSAGAVLNQVNPADRPAMLDALMAASSVERAQTLWAVAGDSLVRVDVTATPGRHQLIALPSELGPLRSVQAAEMDGRPLLLIGARSGVMVIDPEAPAQTPRLFADASMTSQLGFNSVALLNGMIYGSHSDAGLLAWSLDDPMRPAVRAGEGGARNALAWNNRVAFSRDAALTLLDSANERVTLAPDVGEIIALLPLGEALLVVGAGGAFAQVNGQLEVSSAQRVCGRTRAAALLPWLGESRLLLASEEGPIYCVGLEDHLVSQYLSPHQDLRILAAIEGVIAAVSADRQRLLCWRVCEPARPSAEIHLAAVTRHRIADIAFGWGCRAIGEDV